MNEPKPPINRKLAATISEHFGLYKAEWMQQSLFKHFTEPSYFPDLRMPRPCALIGGRGTGKTTVLRGLSYHGQFALANNSLSEFQSWQQIGLYLRADTSHVTAFRGDEVNDVTWTRCFSHYINLHFCDLLLGFASWFNSISETPINLPTSEMSRVCTSLNLPNSNTLAELSDNLSHAILKLESDINNIADGPPSKLTLLKSPIEQLAKALLAAPPLSGKQFVFLIDEYENFLDYQQQVVNTLIKHSNEFFIIKIGARELGWRIRTTLNQNETLIHPADYVKIDITAELHGRAFDDFATKVCYSRLKSAADRTGVAIEPEETFHRVFSELDYDAEAELLGGNVCRDEFIQLSESRLTPHERDALHELSLSTVLLIRFWSQIKNIPAHEVIRSYLENPDEWKDRQGNYTYASLFGLRRTRGIRKYYAGWRTLQLLASGNIRYMIELVQQSLLRHELPSDSALGQISAEAQTLAAQRVGKKYLEELEGVIVGAKLPKLLLGLGRLFQLFAERPLARAPEINQFYIEPATGTIDDERCSTEVDELLCDAVMHLALVRSSGTKQLSEGDTRAYDYMIHPIYAPFFVYSHRRKRKIKLTSKQFLNLVYHPESEIPALMNVPASSIADASLPDQLALFEEYYRADE